MGRGILDKLIVVRGPEDGSVHHREQNVSDRHFWAMRAQTITFHKCKINRLLARRFQVAQALPVEH